MRDKSNYDFLLQIVWQQSTVIQHFFSVFAATSSSTLQVIKNQYKCRTHVYKLFIFFNKTLVEPFILNSLKVISNIYSMHLNENLSFKTGWYTWEKLQEIRKCGGLFEFLSFKSAVVDHKICKNSCRFFNL